MVIIGETILIILLCLLFLDGVRSVTFVEESTTSSILKDANEKSNLAPIALSRYSCREHCHAVIRTKENDAKKFIGVQATLSIHKPKVESNQWSSSRLKLINGNDSIEAGWMVNPEFFGDYEPRSYAKFSAGGKGCINTGCPGYVQVDITKPLGIIHEYNPKGSRDIKLLSLSIGKRDDGNWWLSITTHDENGVVYHPMGYWPKTLFTSMTEVATQVEWGGEIYNPGASKSQPEMGTGKKATFSPSTCAFLMLAKVAEKNGQYVEPGKHEVEKEANCKHFYTSFDGGHPGHHMGRTFYYGGTKWAFCPFCQ